MSPGTEFKKGHMPHNYKPVGTERISKDGYLEIKVEDPKKWKGKHILIWESAHGSIPKNHVVIFADGDKRNFNLENLILITQAQNAVMNIKGLRYDDAELTKTGITVADIYLKIGERKKNK